MFFDFIFSIFSDLPNLTILYPLCAVVALFGIVGLCLSLYRRLEK